jgi:hypothetical protein
VVLVLSVVCCLTLPARAGAYQQPPPPQDEFVAVGDSPAPDQLPAAPLLIAAYIVVLAGFFAYVVSLSRRLGGVQRDVERLEGDLKRRAQRRD